MTDIVVTVSAGTEKATATATFTQGSPQPVGKRIRCQWYHSWKGPFLRNIPPAALANINQFSVGMAQSAQAGTGRVSWSPANNGQSDADFKADVAALKAIGTRVLIGVGGSGDGGIVMTVRRGALVEHPDDGREQTVMGTASPRGDVRMLASAHAGELADSITGLMDRYGFAGVDFDIESGSWTEDTVVAFVDTMRTRKPGFVFGVTPGLYGAYTARWISLCKRLGDRLAFIAPMLYDFPEAHSATTLTPVALQKIQACVAGGIPVEKYVLGLMCNEYYNTTPTADAVKVTKAVLASYPGLGGIMHWEHGSDAAHGWPVSQQVFSLVK